MYGAILGDMIGAPYEFGRGDKAKDFPLSGGESRFTDGTVMTAAVAEALMEVSPEAEDSVICEAVCASMHRWGRRYPDAGSGIRSGRWLEAESKEPCGSGGSGSAMRVSAAGWLYETIGETRRVARLSAAATHDRPEGIKGAEAAASAIFLARTGSGKEEIREYIEREFHYDLSRSREEIRPSCHQAETCQQTVPEAVTAFLEGEDFEDAVRKAVSLGGGSDMLTCITGGIAEAFWGVPAELTEECRKRLPEDIRMVLDRFRERRLQAAWEAVGSIYLEGNERIEAAVEAYFAQPEEETLQAVLDAIRSRMHQDGHFLFPVTGSEKDGLVLRTVLTADGKERPAAFTSQAQLRKGPESRILSNFIEAMLKVFADTDSPGLLLNPWGRSFLLTADLIRRILREDGEGEGTDSDAAVTPEQPAAGSRLKKAVEGLRHCSTDRSLIRLLHILRESTVWVPCRAVMSEADSAALEKILKEAEAEGGLSMAEGKTITNQDSVRMVPDLLESGGDLFFPVFSSEEEMGEYGQGMSRIEVPFPEAAKRALRSGPEVRGAVVDAFTEPFVLPPEVLEAIAETPDDAGQEEAENG